MSTGSIFVVAALVVVALLDSLVNATTSSTPLTATPSSSSTQPVPTPTVTQTPASTSAGSAASVTSSPVHQFTSAGSAASVTSSPVASVAPTEAPRKKTCGSISFAMVMAWNESLYTDKTYIRNYETDLQKWLGNGVFNDSSKYKDVKVSDLKFEKNEEKVKLTFKLCLVLKKDDAGYIEDMFKPGFKYNMMEVTDFEFKADGVELGEWKAKSGECDKCGSDGGAGPIGIERACKPQNDNSCIGLKITYEDKDGCVKYCDSSAAAIMMSSFIIAMGVLLSFSFNI